MAMKKVLMVLGVLTILTSTTYSKENIEKEKKGLRVVSVGQQIRTQNYSGGDDIDLFHFGTAVGFEYGDDWKFDIFARKTWNVDSDRGIHSFNHRLEFNSWKKVNDNFSYGFRYRGENPMDRYTVRAKYSYGIFSGWGDLAYQSNNGAKDHVDAFYAEAEPLRAQLGPVNLGYYIEVDTWALNTKEDGYKHHYRQQLRATTPFYRGEKLDVLFQYRWQFATDRDYDEEKRKAALKKEGKSEFGWAEENKNSHAICFMWLYNFSEQLDFGGYVAYARYSYDAKGGKANTRSDRYNVETQVGWTYKF